MSHAPCQAPEHEPLKDLPVGSHQHRCPACKQSIQVSVMPWPLDPGFEAALDAHAEAARAYRKTLP